MLSGPATSPDPASMVPGQIIAGRYRLERVIGAGGFGTVFAAANLNSGERVALKVLSARVLEMSGGAERFRREAELARRLAHPNIVRVLDAGTDPGGALFIAFELLEGRSLQEEIAQRGAFPPRRAASVCAEVLAALEHAHAQGVVHRDLKPGNVFLLGGAAEGGVKVLDFGIAKSTNPGTRPGLTQDGTAIGTPAYMAPEQLEGGEVRAAADLFSLGVVLAEMLAGKPLFDQSSSAIQILTTRMTRGLPIPESVARSALGPIVAQATQPNPAWRYADARAMKAAIEALLPHLSLDAYATGPRAAGGPTALGGAPTAAQLGITAQSPGWGPAPPWAGPSVAPPSPARQGGGAALLIIAVLFGLAAVAGGAAYALTVQKHSARADRAADDESEEDDDRPLKKKKRSADDEESQPRPQKPSLPPPDRPRSPPPAPEPVRPPDPPPGDLGRSQPCSGIPLAPIGLRTILTQAGFEVSGKLLYCAGDMVNFECRGPRGDGFTVEGGGSASLIKLSSRAEAEAFAKKEASSATREQTYVWDGTRVVRIEMKATEADRLIKKMCKS